MLKKGQQAELHVESLAPGGEGVSKDLSVPIFINKAAPGDKLLAEIFDYRRTFAKANLLKIIEASPDRIEPACKLFKVCGGCQWMHLSYQAQLTWKKNIIIQSLQHIGGKSVGDLCIPLVLPTMPAEQELGYRNKVQLPVRNPQDSKRLLAGYFETNSHNLVNIKHCPIQPSLLDNVLAEIKLLAEKYNVVAYDEKTEKGLLRHIQMRSNESEVLVTFVVNWKNNVPESLKNIAHELMQKFSAVVGVCANLNCEKGNRILGPETICLAGQAFIEEVLHTKKKNFPDILQNGIKFRLSPVSFFQINSAQAIKLLELIAEEIGAYVANKEGGKVTLLDAYAGVGTIALWLSPFVDQILAIENNPGAVKDGELNQQLNKIDNVEFHLAKVEDYLPVLLKTDRKVQIAVLDPPRQGLQPKAIETIMKLQPDLIIYVSCNPVTLSRDLKSILSDCSEPFNGYKVIKIVPIDLFPQTYHIESMTVLTRIDYEPKIF